mmetsp:Transcript_43763/g.103410  ORF Transcript_43763/g.103410 Transcript_43763/m.103410 type:complete len:80 (-) Transcript_43763:8-247(-)
MSCFQGSSEGLPHWGRHAIGMRPWNWVDTGMLEVPNVADHCLAHWVRRPTVAEETSVLQPLFRMHSCLSSVDEQYAQPC